MEHNSATAQRNEGQMKSLLISAVYFPPKMGGISHFMWGVASALGPDQVCCLTGQPDDGPSLSNNLVPRVYRQPELFNGNYRYLSRLRWGTTITEIMLRERPQLVQISSVNESWYGLWLHRWLRLPFVVYAHGNEIMSIVQQNRQKSGFALQQADRVLAVSHFTANLVQKAGVAPERIEIVHPGCDVDRFRPLHPRMDLRQKLLGDRYRDRVIVSVGAFVERKGHDMVIRALPRLRQTIPDVTYLIIGNGSRRAQLENLATALGVRERVIFAGRIADKDLPDIYALSDVFVMPSREELETCSVEGFGLVFLEASACAKPVVGGRSGGIPDAIVDGVTGLLVNPYDPEDIANAFTRLLTDSDLAMRLGHQGRLRVARDFTWTRVADRVQGILDSVPRKK